MEKEVLSMVFDLLKAGHGEQLQDIILDAFSDQLEEKYKGRVSELNDRLERVSELIDAHFFEEPEEMQDILRLDAIAHIVC